MDNKRTQCQGNVGNSQDFHPYFYPMCRLRSGSIPDKSVKKLTASTNYQKIDADMGFKNHNEASGKRLEGMSSNFSNFSTNAS